MRGQRNDVFARGVAGVDQQSVGRPAVAPGDVVDHRPRQARIVAPVGQFDRDNHAFLRRRGDLSIVGGTNCAIGKAHATRLGIARRNLGRLLPGLVLDGPRSARLALRLEPFERRPCSCRPRSCRARLNITRRPLLRRLAPTAEAPGSSVSSRLRAPSRSATAASILISCSPVLNDALLALAQIFAPSTAISSQGWSAPRRSARSRFGSAADRERPPARSGNRRARDR